MSSTKMSKNISSSDNEMSYYDESTLDYDQEVEAEEEYEDEQLDQAEPVTKTQDYDGFQEYQQQSVSVQEEYTTETYTTTRKQLQSPDTCFVFTRKLPSIEDMEAEYVSWLKAETKAAYERLQNRANEVLEWTRHISPYPRPGISTLAPLCSEKDFEEKERFMKKLKTVCTAVLGHFEMKFAKSKYKQMKSAVETARKEADVKRHAKKLTMNKVQKDNTKIVTKEMAKQLEKDNIALAKMLAAAKKAKKDIKKIEHNKWVATNKKLQASYVPVSNLVVIDFDIEDETFIPSIPENVTSVQRIAMKEEIKKIEDNKKEDDERKAAEKAIEEEALASLSKSIIKKQKETVYEDKKEDEESKKTDEEEMFDAMKKKMAKKMGIKTNDEKKKVEKKGKKVVLNLGFKGIIEQAHEKRATFDDKYSKRTNAFEALSGDKKSMEQSLKCTKMCDSVIKGKKCYHKECRYAHSFDQMSECRFGPGCGFVKALGHGWYCEQSFGKTGKKCLMKHYEECEESFYKRLGLVCVKKEVKTEKKVDEIVTKTERVGPVVVDTLTGWSKVVAISVYGKGAEIATKQGFIGGEGLGKESQGIIEPIVAKQREACDRSGIGFKAVDVKPSVNVKAVGFSWVRGGTIQAETKAESKEESKEKVSKWDRKPSWFDTVTTAITKINEKVEKVIEKEEEKEKKTWTIVEKKKDANARKEKKDKKSGWDIGPDGLTKTKERKEIVFRVPKEKAEEAMKAALRSGIKDFRIEII